jgi:AcrR family transcriptional regulator
VNEGAAGELSLRAQQVAQTRTALISAGRRLFGRQGFAGTSVEDLAREARVTTGALYHHFPTKKALFENVFEVVHAQLLETSARAGEGAFDSVDFIARALDAFLDAVLDPEVQRIIVTDAPAVLGQERFIDLDERHSLGPMVASLEVAKANGELILENPDMVARLLFGALTRGAMLIAGSEEPQSTRDQVSQAIREWLRGLAP